MNIHEYQAKELLRAEGYPATQSSVSRDLRDLGAAKLRDGYRLPVQAPARHADGELQVIAEFVRDIRSAGPNLLVIMTAVIGFMTFDWYRQQRSAGAYGAPFTLVDQKGAEITEAAFRGHPSAVFFGFTHCPEVCPTTLFELDGWQSGLARCECVRRGCEHDLIVEGFTLRRAMFRRSL